MVKYGQEVLVGLPINPDQRLLEQRFLSGPTGGVDHKIGAGPALDTGGLIDQVANLLPHPEVNGSGGRFRVGG
jgi:hypothetical protein